METVSTPFYLYVIGIVLTALLSALFLVLGIVKAANRKKNYLLFFLLFLLSFSGLVYSIVSTVNRAKNFLKKELFTQTDYSSYEYTSDTLAAAYDETVITPEKQNYRDSIALFSEGWVAASDNYFTSPGLTEWLRTPLVYPYSLNMVTQLKYAALKNDRYTDYSTGESTESLIEKITFAAFDKKLLLLRTEKNADDEVEFVLFNFRNGKIKTFKRFDKLLDAAKNEGYEGPEELISVEELHYKWF